MSTKTNLLEFKAYKLPKWKIKIKKKKSQGINDNKQNTPIGIEKRKNKKKNNSAFAFATITKQNLKTTVTEKIKNKIEERNTVLVSQTKKDFTLFLSHPISLASSIDYKNSRI